MKNYIITAVCILIAGLGAFFFYNKSEPEIKNALPSGENLICFGDSLTYGTGAPEGMDYPSRLSEKLSTPVINAGIPGDTTATALNRLEQDVLSRSPKIVFITLGGNDLKNGISKKTAFANLKIIVEKIQAEGALVVIGGISIPFWGKGFGEAYDILAKETGAVLIPNIFDGIINNPKLMSDSIHPNAQGYEIMAEMFYKAVKPFI
ncbi:Acylhydrolase family protein [Desulfonema limicola]|uniref:Acylhydrolase family protein n=1 Tax=Desulfonema limicola TaxID=45656 RepID=A0A975B892_9BACT|nr:arylesterase [Desulfonema limicola]QTA80466.1 Acylhydrolase family protein [Desulfonema limicola]